MSESAASPRRPIALITVLLVVFATGAGAVVGVRLLAPEPRLAPEMTAGSAPQFALPPQVPAAEMLQPRSPATPPFMERTPSPAPPAPMTVPTMAQPAVVPQAVPAAGPLAAAPTMPPSPSRANPPATALYDPAGVAPRPVDPARPAGTVAVAPPFGLGLADLTRNEVAQRAGLLTLGVLVTAVAPGSDGAQAGLVAGDRIVSVASQPVISTFHFFFIVSQLPQDRPIRLDIVRDGAPLQIELAPAGLGTPPHPAASRERARS